jgi:hypothetical protein
LKQLIQIKAQTEREKTEEDSIADLRTDLLEELNKVSAEVRGGRVKDQTNEVETGEKVTIKELREKVAGLLELNVGLQMKVSDLQKQVDRIDFMNK